MLINVLISDGLLTDTRKKAREAFLYELLLLRSIFVINSKLNSQAYELHAH